MVECTALEMRHRCKPIGGSNPSLSAIIRLSSPEIDRRAEARCTSASSRRLGDGNEVEDDLRSFATPKSQGQVHGWSASFDLAIDNAGYM